MKKIFVILMCILAFIFVALPKESSITFVSMTTDVTVKTKSRNAEKIKNAIIETEKQITRGKITDDLKRLAEEAKNDTNGYFDVEYKKDKKADYYGIGKGYAVGKGIAVASDGTLINAGGDISCKGEYKIGLTNPETRSSLMTITLTDSSIATSGTYERGNHIINPFTKKAPDDTVISTSCIYKDPSLADAYATGLYASRGKAHEKIIQTLEGKGAGVIIIYSDKRVYISDSIKYENLDKGYEKCEK